MFITQLPGARLTMLSAGAVFVSTNLGLGLLVPAAGTAGNVIVVPRADLPPANDNRPAAEQGGAV